MSKLMIVSADSHAGLPTERYGEYLESKYHDELATYLVQREQSRLAGETLGSSSRRGFASFSQQFLDDFKNEEMVEEGGPVGGWEFDRRTKELEADGVVAEVIYPGPVNIFEETSIPFQGRAFFGDKYTSDHSFEVMWAGARAYNRWLAEVFDPVRQVGLTLIPTLTDIDEVIRELEWGASAGFRGAYIRQLEEGLPLLSDRRYEPMWNACARLGLIVHFHGGVGTPLEPPIETIDGRELPTPSIETAWWGYRPIWHLMFAGVFDRNPELQVVISEVHASWAPNVVDTMDVRWEDIWLQFHDMLPEPPSFYWRRQCSIGASFLSRAEAQQRDLIGADRIMYGNDYPHVEGIWPQTRHFLHESLCGLPEADARMLAGENAVRLYGLDRRALEAIAERVGPPIEEVLGGEPAPPSAYPTDRMAARAARPASWVLGGAHRKLTL